MSVRTFARRTAKTLIALAAISVFAGAGAVWATADQPATNQQGER